MRAVRIYEFGGPENLALVDTDSPVANPGEVVVRVRAAGLNPVDWKVFAGGPISRAFGMTLPSGVGNDFAGEVVALGEGVTGVRIGDRVFGGKRHDALAEQITVDADSLTILPDGVTFEQGAALGIPGRTAAAGIAAIAPVASDVVVVGGAAGGVGQIAVQLAARTGARVLGTASPANFDFLRSLGAQPVDYHDPDAALAYQDVTAALDTHGDTLVHAAIAAGTSPSRIATIAAYGNLPAGVTSTGGADARPGVLTELAELIASGELRVTVQTYPLDDVVAAYEKLRRGHVRGKLVVTL